MTNFAFKFGFWNGTHTRLWLLKKIYKKRKRESSRFHTWTFKKKTHSTRSSWEMPKDNCDSRVTSDVSRSCRLLRIPFESNSGLCSINSFGINPCHQVSTGSIDPRHHSMTLNQESLTWLHTKVWQFIAILQWDARSIPKPYVFLLCRIIEGYRGKP